MAEKLKDDITNKIQHLLILPGNVLVDATVFIIIILKKRLIYIIILYLTYKLY